MKKVAIGLLGPSLDRGTNTHRWENWRPTVSVCQHEDLLVDRFELIYEAKFHKLADTVIADIKSVSPETEVRAHTVDFNDPWEFESVYATLHGFASTYPFETEKEDYLLHITTGTHVAQICLFLLAESRHIPAQLLQTAPPKRKHEAGEYRIIDLDLSKYDQIAERFHLERSESLDFLKSGINTRNKNFNHLIEQIEHVAIHSTAPLLLTGPTGAGKSQLAKRIYELKKQRRQVEGPFIEINCATIRGDTAMSTLFGHKKGAFTGAMKDRPGLLCEANNGVLFLDEVGELGLDEQAMLLRAVEEGRFLPLGSDVESTSQFQLICGTNRDLKARVSQGEFREDLLARINLWSFKLPGLAERKEDIEPNINYELSKLRENTGKQVRFNTEASNEFLRFALLPQSSWDANFRDLNAAITRMATFAPSGRISHETVLSEIQRLKDSWSKAKPFQDNNILDNLLESETIDSMDLFDRLQLDTVINVCKGCRNMSEAGRKLFSVSREKRKSTNDSDRLRKYLSKFDITWEMIQK